MAGCDDGDSVLGARGADGIGSWCCFLKKDFELEKGSTGLLKKEIDQQGLPVAYLLARVSSYDTKKLTRYG
jgi:hypothetical protein